MKIAIIGSFHCHLECIVYLLEILKDNEIHIYIDKDIYKWINYCSKFYNFKVFYNSISILKSHCSAYLQCLIHEQ